MKIDKVMNNNVVSSIDEDGQEIIMIKKEILQMVRFLNAKFLYPQTMVQTGLWQER